MVKDWMLPPKVSSKTKMATPTVSIQHFIEGKMNSAVRQEKEIGGI